MKIVLTENVPHVGQAGQVVEVSNGMARNRLLPMGLATPATDGSIRHAALVSSRRTARRARDTAAAEALAGRLAGQVVRISARAGKSGRLFGAVTGGDVAKALAAAGFEVSRRAVGLPAPVKALGTVSATVRLAPEITATVQVEVVAEA